jgi:ABC-type uncharacterized transport system permease subunit
LISAQSNKENKSAKKRKQTGFILLVFGLGVVLLLIALIFWQNALLRDEKGKHETV